MCVVSQLLSDAKAASIVENLMTVSGQYPWHHTVVQTKTQICVYVASLSVHKVWQESNRKHFVTKTLQYFVFILQSVLCETTTVTTQHYRLCYATLLTKLCALQTSYVSHALYNNLCNLFRIDLQQLTGMMKGYLAIPAIRLDPNVPKNFENYFCNIILGIIEHTQAQFQNSTSIIQE